MHANATLVLEYTPWPTATPALRAAVARAFAQAGRPHVQETTAPGGDGPLPPGFAWAPTSLSVCLVVGADEATPEMAAEAALWSQLRAACAAVRSTVPGLPMGLRVVTARRTTRYAWRPDDAVADIERALDALRMTGSYDCGGVYGWDRSDGQWQPI